MDQAWDMSFNGITNITTPLAVFFVTLLIGYLVRKIVFARFAVWAKSTDTKFDDIIVDAIKGPIMLWFFMAGVFFALEASSLPEVLTQNIGKALLVLGIFSVTLVLANIISAFIKEYSAKMGAGLPTASLTQHISRIVVFTVGVLVILNTLGVSITPILATLGVGGLAVALALQDTLSNLFAGFHIIVAGQIKTGDYVKLDSGEEGYITDITWRATKIRMLPNNEILVPNEKLNKVIVTNYCMPDKEMAVLVNLGVHYGSDLAKVEKVTCEVAKEIMKTIKGGVPMFDPFIRYNVFGDSSINFTVILRAREFVDQYLVKHEFIKLLHQRYAKEGIVIPYPIRAINYEQEKK